MKKWLENSIYVLFGIMIFTLLLIISCFQKVSYMCKPAHVIPNIAIVFTLLILIILGYFYIIRKRKNCRNIHCFKNIDSDKLVKIIIVFLFIGQIYGCYNIIFLSDWDVSVIWNASKNYALNDYTKIAKNYYFHQYPNNLLFMMIQAFLMKMHALFGIFEGERGQLMSVALINCLINSGTCFLVYKSAKLFCTVGNSLFAFFACILLVGISPWSAINYSDAMSLIFPVLVFYLYVSPRTCTWKKRVSQFSAILIGCISYFLKPQCFIIIIAILLSALLKNFKRDLRYIRSVAVLYLCTFLCFLFVQWSIYNALECNGILIDKERKFGVSHFLMMGMNVERNGVFSEEDVTFSSSFTSYRERNKENIHAAAERIIAMGGLGFLKHLTKKMLIAYSDGTFAWGMEGVFFYQLYDCPNNAAAPFMRSLFYRNGDNYMVFVTLEQFVWILVLLLCMCSSFSMVKGKRNELLLLMLSLIGLTIYLLLFEVRARYLYTYVPIFCILAASGKQQIHDIVYKYICCDSLAPNR